MKKDAHPTYYPDAIIHCSCGKTFKIGSTKPEMHVEVCSACHPFYTGQDKIIDTAGRVEKFRQRVVKASTKTSASKKSKNKNKKKE